MRSANVSASEWGSAISAELSAVDAAFIKANEENRLHGYVAALAYLLTALKRYPGFEGGTVTLDDLLLKLTDLTVGKDALRPAARSGAPPHGPRDFMIQGRAAAAVEYLMENGELERDACATIAKELTKRGVRGRRTASVSARTVREWRSQASKFGNKPDAYGTSQASLALLRDLKVASGRSKAQLRKILGQFVVGSGSLPSRVSD